jgi:hypothetical protein
MLRPSKKRTRVTSPRRRRDTPASARPIELVLYISASSRYALTARRNCEDLLSRFDPRRVRFEVCDVSAHPERAEEDAVCYTPMLVKRQPLPRTCLLGDLSNPTPLVNLLESCGLGQMR